MNRTKLFTCAPLLLILATTSFSTWAGDPKIPACTKKLGTLTVYEPSHNWWRNLNLESPETLIKVLVSESKCFTLLDRGKGLNAAKAERKLADSGEFRGGSNIGKGQMKAADYVLVPDLVNKNSDSNGTKIGGALAGLVDKRAAAVVGGISLKSKTADVVLTLTDVRSTEQVSLQKGHAKKTDLGWSAGGGGFVGLLAAGGASSYSKTDIGQVITMAYVDAYAKMVNEIKNSDRDVKAENVSQSVTMSKPGRMYQAPDSSASIVRELDAGMMLYPTGEKQGVWWKVADELGNEGWVSSVLFKLAR